MKTTKIKPQLKSVFVVYGLLITIFVGMMIASPEYRAIGNIGNILVQCVPLAVASLGQTMVMIGGGIDMSLGPVVSLATCIAAAVMVNQSPASAVLGIVLVFAMAVTVGLVNGLAVNVFNLPPMIATLSMMMVLNGVCLAVLPAPGGKMNVEISRFIMKNFGMLSVSLVVLLICFVAMRHILYNTKKGTHIYAIGKNRKIAASMGVNAKRISTLTYVLSAVLAAVTGILLASKMRIGDPNIGTALSMDSITAAAIGGTALTGGAGLVSGSIAGAYLIGMLSNMMNMLGVNHFYQYVLKGLLLVVATVFYSVSKNWKGGLQWLRRKKAE